MKRTATPPRGNIESKLASNPRRPTMDRDATVACRCRATPGCGKEMRNMSRSYTVLSVMLQLLAAGILLQTLFFKFTGAEESVYIFSTLGVEPWGRIASGVVELVAAALLLYPPTAAVGAVLGLGVMAGAILSHLLFLGIAVRGDGGLLFALAVVVFVASSAVLYLRRTQLPILGGLFEVAS
jgi:hypothetical protein